MKKFSKAGPKGERLGQRLVLFDNEPGKGDHKRIGDIESSHVFESVEKLTANFMTDVKRIRSESKQ